jgi:ribulose-5-phosphate 4-epimerase/fuculose-1-phosphate aldolase
MSAPPKLRPASRISAEEWIVRRDLAAAYRLAALYGWEDMGGTHISARVAGEEAFLINPYELLFEEITASSLVKVDLAGNILGATEYTINPAGFVVHSAIHRARHAAGCVMHLHTHDGVAVSCLAEGILPLSQAAMLISDRIGYHDYEGVALDSAERERLARDLGDFDILILRNHGTLTTGCDVGEAFVLNYHLERVCATQLRILATGRPTQEASGDARAKTAEIGRNMWSTHSKRLWLAHKRKLDRHSVDYKN